MAAEMIPAQIMADFGDANWKVRLAATEEMQSWVEKEAASIDAEVLVRAIAKKGWSEKNFQVGSLHRPTKCPFLHDYQVSAKLYVVLDTLAQQCPSFGRSCIALSVPHLTEKLGDMKLKKPAGDTLLTFAEKASLQFVLHQGKSSSPYPSFRY